MKCSVYLFFQYFRSGYGTYISAKIHIPQGNIRTAHKVDKITGCFRILGILRDHPTVIPDITSFLRNFIVQIHSYRISLFNRPNRITAPSHIQPGFIFRHHLLAEIRFPTGNIRFQSFQIFFSQLHRTWRVVIHQLFHCHCSLLQFLCMCIDHSCSVSITITILHQDLSGILFIPKAIPGQGYRIGHISPVIQNTCRPPHITYSIAAGFFTRLTQFINLLTNKWSHIIHVIGRMCEIRVDR